LGGTREAKTLVTNREGPEIFSQRPRSTQNRPPPGKNFRRGVRRVKRAVRSPKKFRKQSVFFVFCQPSHALLQSTPRPKVENNPQRQVKHATPPLFGLRGCLNPLKKSGNWISQRAGGARGQCPPSKFPSFPCGGPRVLPHGPFRGKACPPPKKLQATRAARFFSPKSLGPSPPPEPPQSPAKALYDSS